MSYSAIVGLLQYNHSSWADFMGYRVNVVPNMMPAHGPMLVCWLLVGKTNSGEQTETGKGLCPLHKTDKV